METKEIMDMPSGTKIKNKFSGRVFLLGDYVNDVARELCNLSYVGMGDYINKNSQKDYEVIYEES